ncbi:hypothetical protein [Streptomyces roseoverticillatus]|uniref:hypothetical protein n=1 Tax=Streptomyces roseoverticillatus TaxID=66429 RepID=UPI0012FEE039|nr:hypothetical protein [Streptomyces roseoverticillatus]
MNTYRWRAKAVSLATISPLTVDAFLANTASADAAYERDPHKPKGGVQRQFGNQDHYGEATP